MGQMPPVPPEWTPDCALLCLSVCLCFQMKMPVTIGQKKAKLIEQLLDEMGVGKRHMKWKEPSSRH